MQGKKKGRAEYWMGVVNWDSETSARQVKDALLQKEHPPSTKLRNGPPAPSLPFLGRYSVVVELVVGSGVEKAKGLARSRGLSSANYLPVPTAGAGVREFVCESEALL
jgi:hypothetical protein